MKYDQLTPTERQDFRDRFIQRRVADLHGLEQQHYGFELERRLAVALGDQARADAASAEQTRIDAQYAALLAELNAIRGAGG